MDLERELALHHEAKLRAIETGRLELAEGKLKSYVQFAETFVDAAAKYGVRFSPESARSASFLDWPTATQIGQYAWDGIAAAVRSGNRELLRMAASLPISFLQMSARKQDFLFFWKMVRMYPYILSMSYSAELASVSSLVVDVSWRYLREFIGYFLIDATRSYEESTKRQYIQLSLWAFSDLLKVAMDQNDIDTFGHLGRELNLLFQELEVHNLDTTELESLHQYIGIERSLIWFGLGAWLVRSQELSKSPRIPGEPDQKIVQRERIGDFMQVVAPNFPNIRELSIAYHEAYGRQHRWYWERWLGETLTEREVHTIDFGEWLTWFYTVEGLRLSKSGNPVASDIPKPDRELQYRLKDIQDNIDRIKAEPENWRGLLPFLQTPETDQALAPSGHDRLQEAAGYFLSANELSVKEWRHLREDHVIASPLNEARLTEFRDECAKGWAQQSWAVQLFSTFGRREERTAEPGATYTALHYLMPKDAFIEDPDAIYAGFGRDSGGQLGRDVSRLILKQLESASTHVQAEQRASTIDKVRSAASDLGPGSSAAVVVSGGFELERQFLKHLDFVPRWRDSNPLMQDVAYLGRLGKIPIFFQLDEQRERVVVAALKEAAKLLHHVPPEDNYGGLLIRVRSIDEHEAKRLVETQPQRLQDKGGILRQQDEVIRELMLKVAVFVGAKVELEIVDSSKAVYIPIQGA